MATDVWEASLRRLQQQFDHASQWYMDQHAGAGFGCVLVHAGPKHRPRLSEKELRNVIGSKTAYIDGGFSHRYGAAGWRIWFIGDQVGVSRFLSLAERAGKCLRMIPREKLQDLSEWALETGGGHLQWCRCVFELAWQTKNQSPLQAAREIWTGQNSYPWCVRDLKYAAAIGLRPSFPLEWINDLPDYYCSKLDDIFQASSEAIELLIERQNSSPPVPDREPARFEFRRSENPEFWTVTFDGVSKPIRHLKGMAYLALLLARPNYIFTAFELEKVVEGLEHMNPGQLHEPKISRQAHASATARLEELKTERDIAERNEDASALDRINQETRQIEKYLERARGLNGRPRFDSDAIRRDRRVRVVIKRAIGKISQHSKKAGAHLDRFLDFKNGFAYCPESARDWQF